MAEEERSRSICDGLQKTENLRTATTIPRDQKKCLKKELTYFQKIENIGIRTIEERDDLEVVSNECFFENIVKEEGGKFSHSYRNNSRRRDERNSVEKS